MAGAVPYCLLPVCVAVGFLWHSILLIQHYTSSGTTPPSPAIIKPHTARGVGVLLLQEPRKPGFSGLGLYSNRTLSAGATKSSHQRFHIGGEIGWISFALNPVSLCEPNEEVAGPELLVLVHSHPLHKPQRDAIRDTWGRVARDYERPDQVRLVFLLGMTDSEADLPSVHKESRMYRDVILADFADTYRNLTVKSLTGIFWARTFCDNAPFILKTDDDVYFNVSGLLGILPGLGRDTTMLGALNPHATVMRFGQWRVDVAQLPDEYYPPYCAGCAYLMRAETARTIMSTFHRVPILPIEDVYVTGMVAKQAGLQCTNHPLFPHWNVGPSRTHVCKLVQNQLLAIHNVYYEMMYWVHGNITRGVACT